MTAIAKNTGGMDFKPLNHHESFIFDLDNTLYPAASALFSQIDRRMGEFISALLRVDRSEARHIQKRYLVEHGTTLRGLMERHDVEPQGFLDMVHDIDLSPITPDQKLHKALTALPGRKFVFTNADRRYADRVLRRLKLDQIFDGVFDITDADYWPKPHGPTYDLMLERFSVTPNKALMVEDMARNLKPAHERGMTTVWIESDDPWARPEDNDTETPHIHHRTENLTAWLEHQLGTET